MRSVIIFFLCLLPVTALAAPVLYTGTMQIKAVSGKNCTVDEVGRKLKIQMVFERNGDKVNGYFLGSDINIGKFSGDIHNRITVVYPFLDKKLAEEDFLKISVFNDSITGELASQQVDNSCEYCSWDKSELKLTALSDQVMATVAIQQSAAYFDVLLLTEAADKDAAGNLFDKALENYSRAIAMLKPFEKHFLPDTGNLIAMTISTLWNRKGNVYHSQQKYSDAEIAYRLSMELNPSDIVIVQNLIGTLVMNGHFKRALDQLKDSKNNIPSDQDQNTLKEATALALYEKAATIDDNEKAIQVYEKSYAFYEALNHAGALVVLYEMARRYELLGELEKSEQNYLKTIKLAEEHYAQEPYQLAVPLTLLANLYLASKRFSEAETQYIRALEVREISLGPEHADVASSLNSLAHFYTKTGRYQKAEALFKRALTVQEKPGMDNKELAVTLNNYGQMLYSVSRYDEAETLMKRSLDIFEKSFGPFDHKTTNCISNLADLYLATGRKAESDAMKNRLPATSAEELFERMGKISPQKQSSTPELQQQPVNIQLVPSLKQVDAQETVTIPGL